MNKQENIKLISKRLCPGSYRVTDPAGRIWMVETQEVFSEWMDESQSAKTSWHLFFEGYVEAETPAQGDGYCQTYGAKADAMDAIRHENELKPELSDEQRTEIEDHKRYMERWKTGNVSVTVRSAFE